MRDLTADWALPTTATLGSSLRARGIERELRRRMPWTLRKCLVVEAGRAILTLPEAEADEFRVACDRIAHRLSQLAELPVLPRELEDILSISAHERHKWTKDGRLTSIGTRTVKLRGRSRSVTFHVYDPLRVEEILDGDLPALWREEDAQTKAENRRRAAAKAALARAAAKAGQISADAADATAADHAQLEGWDAFAAEGLLR